MYWLREQSDGALVREVERLSHEVAVLARYLTHPSAAAVGVSVLSSPAHAAALDVFALAVTTTPSEFRCAPGLESRRHRESRGKIGFWSVCRVCKPDLSRPAG